MSSKHNDSITALNRQMSKLLTTAVIPHLTPGHLTADGRQLTTQVAEWVWKQELADGTRPHGIVYSSKHGFGWRCWAIWPRRVDDGLDAASEPTTAGQGLVIPSPTHDRELEEAQKTFGLRLM
jgi:hypothetical protein